jgi:predicted 2-oxoglutarate/Fe(II)-dependent dioxygenase YbiX
MECVRASLQRLQDDRPRGSLGVYPPVLVLPNAMDPDVCAQLINTWSNPVPLWEGDGKNSIGLNIEKSDVKVRNATLSTALDDNVLRRVVPEIEKAFAYSPSKREEYRIACYDVADGGSLPAYRDNPTTETRHRRFTVSINLNNDDFDGGELAFREFSYHLYDIDAGTAVIWSCSVLHEVMPITARR